MLLDLTAPDLFAGLLGSEYTSLKGALTQGLYHTHCLYFSVLPLHNKSWYTLHPDSFQPAALPSDGTVVI